ncbi:type II toxin-antitoxin system RelE family toxin [Corynebacterium efficiens]|uniref:type II toxin-antitoxin system RelE family toxin n=1 Tax=Corynebacterium efficiens TaxID=152794 RepID=UPI00117D9368|nr:type II toxin-antitoxin system RelE/ParE family toxin [Corynebacterium efficiens]
MPLPEPRARVRLTDDAVADLRRLKRKDPQIVREVFKKMLLLERATDAGEPLLGALVGFRKLVVGDCDYRIAWGKRPMMPISRSWRSRRSGPWEPGSTVKSTTR